MRRWEVVLSVLALIASSGCSSLAKKLRNINFL